MPNFDSLEYAGRVVELEGRSVWIQRQQPGGHWLEFPLDLGAAVFLDHRVRCADDTRLVIEFRNGKRAVVKPGYTVALSKDRIAVVDISLAGRNNDFRERLAAQPQRNFDDEDHQPERASE